MRYIPGTDGFVASAVDSARWASVLLPPFHAKSILWLRCMRAHRLPHFAALSDGAGSKSTRPAKKWSRRLAPPPGPAVSRSQRRSRPVRSGVPTSASRSQFGSRSDGFTDRCAQDGLSSSRFNGPPAGLDDVRPRFTRVSSGLTRRDSGPGPGRRARLDVEVVNLKDHPAGAHLCMTSNASCTRLFPLKAEAPGIGARSR